MTSVAKFNFQQAQQAPDLTRFASATQLSPAAFQQAGWSNKPPSILSQSPANTGVTFTVQAPGGTHTTVTSAKLSAPPVAPAHLEGVHLMAWQKANMPGHINEHAKDFRPRTEGNVAEMYPYRRNDELALGVLHRATDVASFGGKFLATKAAEGALLVAGVGSVAKAAKATDTTVVSITGATGSIGEHLLQQLSARGLGDGKMLHLKLHARQGSEHKLNGALMELQDSAPDLVRKVEVSPDLRKVFGDSNMALLVAGQQRKEGMERADLLLANGAFFKEQGQAFAESAAKGAQAVVVGNPANTNALIFSGWAPNATTTALMALDHARLRGALAEAAGVPVALVKNAFVLGNHSAKQVPTAQFATIDGRPAFDVISADVFASVIRPNVQNRGAAIIAERGQSSAPSVAKTIVDQAQWLTAGSPNNQWVTLALRSDGKIYGVPEGLFSGVPAIAGSGGQHKIIGSLELDEVTKSLLSTSTAELLKERDIVKAFMR